MPRATINVPTIKNTTLVAEGNVVLYMVGGKRVRFIVQDRLDGREVDSQLVHAASGIVAVPANMIKATKLANFRTGKRMTDRAAASDALAKLIRRKGTEVVLDAIASAPRINPIPRNATL